MKRRQFCSKSACSLAGITAGILCPQLFSCSPKENVHNGNIRPNIIIIVADDAGWCDVGYHGSEIKTPNIDRLAGAGVELDQFFAYPTCSPTRASLLTGRPPSRYGILGPIAMRSKLALPRDTVTLAEMLKKQGYDTAITGKWHLGLRPEVGPGEYGFNYSYGYLHGQIDQFTHIYKNGDRSWHRNGEFIEEEGHATDLITNDAISFIRERRETTKPFFLYVPYSVPHYPLQEDDRWIEPYRNIIDNESRRLFAASMTHMDDGIGRILSALGEEQFEENTLVIFFSDNGGQEQWTPTFEYDGKFSPNDRLGNNLPLRGWKGGLYEGGIRVPALMYWPGRLKPRKVTETVVVYDIFPTLTHLSGAQISGDRKIEGTNIWPALTGGRFTEERIFYWRTSQQLALRKGGWKLIHNGATTEEGSNELFHITVDPYEEQDMAQENPAKLEELRKELVRQFSMDAR